MFPNLSIRKWIYVEKASSTNEILSDTYSFNYPNANILLYSFNQEQGKGQLGSQWYSGKNKNIAMSYYFPMQNMPAQDQWFISIFFSLTILRWLKQFIPTRDLKIKWPNDIYYKTQKLGGILIQNTINKENITHTIVGFGLNINDTEFPDDLPNPTSLHLITDEEYNLQNLVREFTIFMEGELSGFTPEVYSSLRNEYVVNLYGYNIFIPLRIEEFGQFNGSVLDVANDGRIKIMRDGYEELYNMKEVKFIF